MDLIQVVMLPTTQQQELITLKIFEELLSSKTKNYKKFEANASDTLRNISQSSI